jgi:hypothetical protein
MDADFTGLCGHEDAHNHPLNVHSHNGYVLTIGGCPIHWVSHWVSKLQTQTDLSTMEAEYITLSRFQSGELLPMRELVKEVRLTLKLNKAFKIKPSPKYSKTTMVPLHL